MGFTLLCAVAFCFLGQGFMDATVTQTERYLVKRRGDKVVMDCQQNMDHNSMFWYRQDPALGLQLLYFSDSVGDKQEGDAPEGYSVSRKKKENFTLILDSASTNQTSVYLCASSL
uniref:Ig-like domain-containing protein n=1 Tax=Equus asinus TaxID=9793 RepID=A0A8C4LRU7_EQUAS